MDKIRYVILNGPAGSGKSIFAREICSALNNGVDYAITDSFAAPMKHFFSTALGRRYDTFMRDNPVPELNGFTMRDCLIDLAENYIKKRYGDDIFGRWLAHRSLHHPKTLPNYVVIDDGLGGPELTAIDNHFIVKVSRAGKTFAGDSRKYYENHHAEWENVGPLPGLWKSAEAIAYKVKGHKWK